jgi:membrane-bound lytic murein transglycosylase D
MMFTATIVFALLQASCQTSTHTSHVTSSDMQPISSESEQDGSTTSTDEEVDESENIAASADDEGFCRDDVYSSYLREEFLKGKPSTLKVIRGKQSRVASRRLEMEALYHIRKHLVGPMPEFYGALPVVANPLVELWMRYFRNNGREQFLKWLVRGEAVESAVRPIILQEGLPAEIFFLAMIESGFSTSAFSKAKATGPWQFMKGTAQLYGLKMSYWVDERKDPLKSTVAAARYLRDMYARFGDWYLAMAAYNAGPGKISRAIRGTGSKDFWKIAETSLIRPETRNYVPKVLAAAILASNPTAHGFDFKRNDREVIPNGVVYLARPVRIDELASILSVSKEEILKWNPELLRGITPPVKLAKGETYALRIPENLVAVFSENESQLTKIDVKDVTVHKIASGDTLIGIARKYNTSLNEIKTYNPDLNSRLLRQGQTVAIPVPDITFAH